MIILFYLLLIFVMPPMPRGQNGNPMGLRNSTRCPYPLGAIVTVVVRRPSPSRSPSLVTLLHSVPFVSIGPLRPTAPGGEEAARVRLWVVEHRLRRSPPLTAATAPRLPSLRPGGIMVGTQVRFKIERPRRARPEAGAVTVDSCSHIVQRSSTCRARTKIQTFAEICTLVTNQQKHCCT
jgi:hypothetical protein